MAMVLVTGYMVRMPVAGNVLAFAQYVAGLQRLGHRVVYLEESGWPESCYDPEAKAYTSDPAVGLGRVREMLRAIGVEDGTRLLYVDRETRETSGGSWREVCEHIGASDLLLSIGGVCWLDEFVQAPRRALIDMDPMFTQAGKFACDGLDGYDTLFTYGTNISQPGCRIPTVGRQWRPLVPPVMPELWRVWSADVQVAADAKFTTVANWSAYGSVTHEGEQFGQKNEEFERVVDLPRRSGAAIELAVSGMPGGVQRQFTEAGWSLRPAHEVGYEFGDYVRYLCESRGEFSVAKQGYVASNSGWVSDRTACYLAAGGPAVVQATCASVPESIAFRTFRTVDEAAAHLRAVCEDEAAHRAAARELAESHFSYRRVLPQLLEAAWDRSAEGAPRE